MVCLAIAKLFYGSMLHVNFVGKTSKTRSAVILLFENLGKQREKDFNKAGAIQSYIEVFND